jgi:hypothetical protein
MLNRAWSCVLVLLLVDGGVAQTSQGEKVHAQVGKIGALGNITVYMPSGEQYYGTIRRIEAAAFTIDEVDQRREITLRYDEVKKVRNGYGTGHAINGKRIHPHTRLIVACAVIGGLLFITMIALVSDR